MATGDTEVNDAWGALPLVVVLSVVFATPALAVLAAVYLLALRRSLSKPGDRRARSKSLALSPILVAPWVILSILDPDQWVGAELVAPVLLAGAILYAWLVPLPGASRAMRVHAIRRAALGVLAVAATVYLTLGVTAVT